MTMMVTLLLTFMIIGILFLLFYRVKAPYYRVDKDRMVHVLEMALTGQATENDWQVAFSMVIRHAPELEMFRQRCVDVEDAEYTGLQRPPYLFSAQGLQDLEAILNELNS